MRTAYPSSPTGEVFAVIGFVWRRMVGFVRYQLRWVRLVAARLGSFGNGGVGFVCQRRGWVRLVRHAFAPAKKLPILRNFS